ncbi:cutinase [Mycobacterium sp. 1274761.0]|nr:cutinase [Mycobacterium sp. 1274761.0]
MRRPVTAKSQTLRCMAAVVVSLTALFGPQATALADAAEDPSCSDVEVVFARGTFEAPGVGATGQAFVDALKARLGSKSVDVYGVDYPASLDFQAAASGVADAANKVQAITTTCNSTQIVLGGYSQGAAVAGYTTTDTVPAGVALPDGLSGTLPPAVAARVAAVVLFGTPSDAFLHLVARDAPPIAIGHLYAAKALQLCNPGDPICFPGGTDRSAHSAYKTNGMADQAADFAARALSVRH